MANHRLRAAAFLAILLSCAAATAAPMPRIVNGAPTSEVPAAGALLQYSQEEPIRLGGLCSGTLIGCRTFIVAAHCVCPTEASNASECLAGGTTEPALLRVYLPHLGIVAVESVAIHPHYAFAEGGDAAIVRLAAPAAGIQPRAINLARRPPLGTRGRIVGYGSTGGPPFRASDFGVKRDGLVTTAACQESVANETHVCWQFDGSDASTCAGDSGGPLLVDLGEGPVLAGIVSGGESFDCSPPDQVFTTDVYVHREWIEAQLAGDQGTACGDLPAIGEDGALTDATSAVLDDTKPELRVQLEVPAGTRLLRFALNGQEAGGDGFFRVENDFDLYVRAGAAPTTEDYDCADFTYGVFGFCEIENPVPGAWSVLVTRATGEGRIQITGSSFAADLAGDANCDDRRGAADPLALLDLVGRTPADPCERADANRDGTIDADDLEPTIHALFGR